jgi:hypothetical protein
MIMTHIEVEELLRIATESSNCRFHCCFGAIEVRCDNCHWSKVKKSEVHRLSTMPNLFTVTVG